MAVESAASPGARLESSDDGAESLKQYLARFPGVISENLLLSYHLLTVIADAVLFTSVNTPAGDEIIKVGNNFGDCQEYFEPFYPRIDLLH